MVTSIVLFVVSLLGVTKTADWFLSAAEKVGLYLKLPRFIMGVVLVGFGTSLPELTTSLAAVAGNESHIAVSNIMGSNIANILIIIGVSTIIMGTIRFTKELIDIDLPLLTAISIFFMLLVIDGTLSRIDGALLLAGFVGYVAYSLFFKEQDTNHHQGILMLARALFRNTPADESNIPERPSLLTYAALIGSVIGLGLLSKIAVDSLLGIVDSLGIAVGIVSFFALAIGTSLPELVVSLKALKLGHGDLVVGNIIGSCMFNILLIGGVSAVLLPQELSLPDGYWMIVGLVASTILLVISGITRRLHIWEGASFLLVYAGLALQLID